MIVIKLATPEDNDKIKKFCEQHSMPVPASQTILLAFNEGGEHIIGIIGLEKIIAIEPIIATSAMVANDLYWAVHGILCNERVDVVEAYTSEKSDPHMKTILSGIGFRFKEKLNRYYRYVNKPMIERKSKL